jgi:hypothetical protein
MRAAGRVLKARTQFSRFSRSIISLVHLQLSEGLEVRQVYRGY